MSTEATIHCGMQINKDDASGNIQFKSRTTRFQADVSGAFGPTPGALTVPPGGENVDLSELTVFGLCYLESLEPTDGTGNIIEYGLWDGANFFPLGMILPGEAFPIRLSYNIQREYDGSGTGTSSADVNHFRIRAYTGSSAKVFVGAFEA